MAWVNDSPNLPSVKLSTDLWLSRSTSAAQPLKAINQQSGQKDADPLVLVTTTLKKDCALVLFSFQEGRIGLFQESAYGATGVCSRYLTTLEVPMNAFYEHHKDSIQFGYRCFDRLLLNGLIQPFQQPERVIGFFKYVPACLPGEPRCASRNR
jgi:hypothetical protein